MDGTGTSAEKAMLTKGLPPRGPAGLYELLWSTRGFDLADKVDKTLDGK